MPSSLSGAHRLGCALLVDTGIMTLPFCPKSSDFLDNFYILVVHERYPVFAGRFFAAPIAIGRLKNSSALYESLRLVYYYLCYYICNLSLASHCSQV